VCINTLHKGDSDDDDDDDDDNNNNNNKMGGYTRGQTDGQNLLHHAFKLCTYCGERIKKVSQPTDHFCTASS
jgi:hypothetical protein